MQIQAGERLQRQRADTLGQWGHWVVAMAFRWIKPRFKGLRPLCDVPFVVLQRSYNSPPLSS